MKTIEGMALELFNKFSLRETGKIGSWAHLSNYRKLDWMKEILIMAEYYHGEVLKNIKPIPATSKNETSYGAGYNDGIRAEREYATSLFEDQFQKLLDEYCDFEYKVKDSKN